jgi:hypothetical protein
MKKLLAMIVMLGFAMPIWATEVKLVCNYMNISEKSNTPLTFDEEKKTLLFQSSKPKIATFEAGRITWIETDILPKHSAVATLNRETGELTTIGDVELKMSCHRLQQAF